MTGDLFTARFADCHFDENVFPKLGGEIKIFPKSGGENKQLEKEITWNAPTLNIFDPRTNQCELEVQRLIHLQGITNQFPDAFNDINKVTKSHIPAENAPAKIEVPEGQIIKANESRPRMKRVAVYVDDLNIIGTPEELQKTVDYLKAEFEMKDLGRTNLCLGLQIEHLPNRIFVHQSSYTENILKQFYMDKSHPFNSPMVVRSLDKKKDVFRPKEKNEEILGPEVPYLSAIGALMYLANNTRPNIAFSVNLLARHSNAPTRRHWHVTTPVILKYQYQLPLHNFELL
ncbi:hypothetical protein AgCh_036931 [Apium graveolens]